MGSAFCGLTGEGCQSIWNIQNKAWNRGSLYRFVLRLPCENALESFSTFQIDDPSVDTKFKFIRRRISIPGRVAGGRDPVRGKLRWRARVAWGHRESWTQGAVQEDGLGPLQLWMRYRQHHELLHLPEESKRSPKLRSSRRGLWWSFEAGELLLRWSIPSDMFCLGGVWQKLSYAATDRTCLRSDEDKWRSWCRLIMYSPTYMIASRLFWPIRRSCLNTAWPGTITICPTGI